MLAKMNKPEERIELLAELADETHKSSVIAQNQLERSVQVFLDQLPLLH